MITIIIQNQAPQWQAYHNPKSVRRYDHLKMNRSRKKNHLIYGPQAQNLRNSTVPLWEDISVSESLKWLKMKVEITWHQPYCLSFFFRVPWLFKHTHNIKQGTDKAESGSLLPINRWRRPAAECPVEGNLSSLTKYSMCSQILIIRKRARIANAQAGSINPN